ncbi:MAG TPA: hypothetical protein VF618_12325 [Thermoanaerobaculia bacterium]
MDRSIKVHVQADRLPDVDGFVMLGLRVSGAIVPGVTGENVDDPAQAADDKLILPWLWLKADQSPWTAHDAKSWKLYHLRADGSIDEIVAPVTVLSAAGAGVPAFDPKGRLRTRIDQEVKNILDTFGPRQAFEVPAQPGVLSGRTAYGLAESLTSLPNPVPAAMNVWTAAWFEKAKLTNFGEEDQFLAAPVFAVTGTSYEPQKPALVNGTWTSAMANGGAGLDAFAAIVPSLQLSRLQIIDNPERLIDLSMLTIRSLNGKGFEGSDWIGTLGHRLAEAIDPAARTMAVLDTTIQDAAEDPQFREALVADMTPPPKKDPADADKPPADLLRTALRELHRPIVAPRARRSEAAMAPAAALLESLASQMPQLWPSIVPLLLAQAGAETGANTPATPRFEATSCARILGAAGITPSPELVTADRFGTNAGSAADRVPLLDSEADFAGWLFRHWTSFPPAVSTADARTYEGTSRRFIRGDVATNKTRQEFDATGIVDFSRVPAGIVVVPILFSAIDAQLPATARVVWKTPQADRKGSTITVELTFAADRTTLVVNGNAEGGDFGKLVQSRLFFEVAPGASEITVRYHDGTKQHSVDVPISSGGRVGITVTTPSAITAGIDPAVASVPPLDRERLATQSHTLRAALSWAYAAPIVPELVKGWAPVVDAFVPGTSEREPLDKRLRIESERFITGAFTRAFEKAAGGLTGVLLGFFMEKLLPAAIQDGSRLATSVVPPPLGEADRVTEDALPLAFLVSNLQDFDETDDLWGRLAGVGVLISRDAQLAADEWWSLNAASLHVTMEQNQQRLPLTSETAVLTAADGGGADDWKRASRVDPVPLSVGDVGGVRSALIRYENHSIVGEVEGAPQLDPAGRPVGPRRPEAFLFPPSQYRMPALTFGRRYGILPYLIGHGGALPLALRKERFNPVIRHDGDAVDKFKIDRAKLGDAGADYVHVRKTSYPRTVPVSAPRLSEAQWPAPFPGVDSIADELPLRLPPITIVQDASASFFIQKERLTGLLSGREAAIRFELGAIHSKAENAATLTVRVKTAATVIAEIVVPLATLRTAVGAGAEYGLRIEMRRTMIPELWALKRRENVTADHEPAATKLQIVPDAIAIAVKDWDSAFVEVSASGGTIDLEPPTIRWASLGEDGAFLLSGDRPLPPPELAHAARKVAVLDGIKVGAKTGTDTITLKIRRPSTPVATYERWINGPTGLEGNVAHLETIRRAINAARNHTTTLSKGDRSVDDPAVEAILVEVLQLFPQRVARAISGKRGPIVISRVTPAIENVIGLKKAIKPQDDVMVSEELATIVVNVNRDLLPDQPPEQADIGTHDGRNLTLKFAPGCVYEIRIYGAVPTLQSDLFSKNTKMRFSPAVAASWRDVHADGQDWHLGTPMTLTVEVATEIMPECWPVDHANFSRPSFALDVARPPVVVDEGALVRLVPENLGPPIIAGAANAGLRYPALRYVNRAALMTQRWSWRGRPHPEVVLEGEPSYGTKGKVINTKLGEFIDAAFLGRADDDIGAVREVSFTRAHALGGKSEVVTSSTEGSRPVLLEHDFDRRAGAHLWRFALRLKSRYAAMRPNHPDLLRFSHRVRGDNTTHWWRMVVPERLHPERPVRLLERPALMLVLPLTEPLMTEGSVPPLLAVFNEELFPQFNATDGIETVIDVARHPLPGHARISRGRTPEGSNQTFGELFDAAWKEVEEARAKLDEANAKFAEGFTLGATLTAQQQTNLETDRKVAAGVVAAKELAFNNVQAQAAAWGVVDEWTKIHKTLDDQIRAAEAVIADGAASAEAKAAAQKIIDRLTLPRKNAAAQIGTATAIAEAMEKKPVSPAGAPVNPQRKYFQEIAPDPIREATPAADRPVAVRIDGPVGYTFDAGVEAGRFGHAALLVSPVAEGVRPGSFVRLRFRRFESPGLLVSPPLVVDEQEDPPDQWPDEAPAGMKMKIPGDGARFLIARPTPDGKLDADAQVHRFATAYEGLAFDIADLAAAGAIAPRFTFVPSKGDIACDALEDGTMFLAATQDSKVTISAKTNLGDSANWALPLSRGAKVALRAVVSLRPRPIPQSGELPKEYSPAGDLSIRVRITPDPNDPIRRPYENVWLSILCMPINTGRKLSGSAAIRVCPKSELETTVLPLRLSDFAPPVWCQFAATMSRFVVHAKTSANRQIREVLPVTSLKAKLAGATTFELGLEDLRQGETLTALTLTTEGAPAEDAQIEEPIYAVVTRFVYDAFDRLRERAIGIHPLRPGSVRLLDRIWPGKEEKDREAYEPAMRGRIRLLRVVRGKIREAGGFETRTQEFPGDFFGKETDESLDANPFDAAGMALGISAPIDWGAPD